MMELAITQAYLLRLNRYALENGLISDEIYRKMEVSLRANYANIEAAKAWAAKHADKLKQPPKKREKR